MPMEIPVWKRRWIVLAHKSGKSDEEVAALIGETAPTVARVLVGHFFWETKNRNGHDRCPGCGGLVNIWPCLECLSHTRATVG